MTSSMQTMIKFSTDNPVDKAFFLKVKRNCPHFWKVALDFLSVKGDLFKSGYGLGKMIEAFLNDG